MTPAWDDLDEFLDPEEFAVRVVLSFQSGGTRTFNALFDDPAAGLKWEKRNPRSEGADLRDYTADAEHPRIWAKASDLVGVRRKDSAVIGHVVNGQMVNPQTFGVLTGPQPDGTGGATVSLVLES